MHRGNPVGHLAYTSQVLPLDAGRAASLLLLAGLIQRPDPQPPPPTRAADAAVGILAFNVASRRNTADPLLGRYAMAHLDRIPPPVTVIAGINYGRSLGLKQILTMIKTLRALRAC